jgi:hypothetical protein
MEAFDVESSRKCGKLFLPPPHDIRYRAVKTGYPARDGPAHDGFGLLRAGPKRPER